MNIMNTFILRWNILHFRNCVPVNPPPDSTPVLVCDHSGNLAVCVYDKLSNDFLLDLQYWNVPDDLDPVYDEEGNKSPRNEQTCYFPEPCAWLSLPRPPMELLIDEVEDAKTYAMVHYPLMDIIEEAVLKALRQKDIPPWERVYKK